MKRFTSMQKASLIAAVGTTTAFVIIAILAALTSRTAGPHPNSVPQAQAKAVAIPAGVVPYVWDRSGGRTVENLAVGDVAEVSILYAIEGRLYVSLFAPLRSDEGVALRRVEAGVELLSFNPSCVWLGDASDKHHLLPVLKLPPASAPAGAGR